MRVSAMVGKPKLMAPAAVAYLRSSTSPSASTKANTRYLLYSMILRALPASIPPNVSAERAANPRAYTAEMVSMPNGTVKVS